MLPASYAVAAAAILVAAIYFFVRLRLFITTTTMLLGSLLLIYGPAVLSFTLSSGEAGFLINRLSGYTGPIQPHSLFLNVKQNTPDFDAVVIAMNFSVALMYAGILTGIEIVDRFFPKRIAMMRTALVNWSGEALRDIGHVQNILLIVILVVAAFMSFFLITEHQVTTIRTFLEIPGGDGNAARNLFRLHFGGSHNYGYRLVLGAVAPMLVIWGLLAGGSGKSRALFSAACLLLLVTLVGDLATLSKAPPAFFLIQLMVPALLIFTNRINWGSALAIACVAGLAFYAITRLIMNLPEGASILQTVYVRAFEAESQSLLENFATFPFVHPHMWGANIRPLAMLMGTPFVPAYSIVAHTWYGTYDVTSPSLFIADAWADFSYAGVLLFSVLAGAVCRSIDAIFLARGKTAVGIAVLGAAFVGVLTLLTTALNTALFSGGLLLAPILAGLLILTGRRFDRPRSSPDRATAGE